MSMSSPVSRPAVTRRMEHGGIGSAKAFRAGGSNDRALLPVTTSIFDTGRWCQYTRLCKKVPPPYDLTPHTALVGVTVPRH